MTANVRIFATEDAARAAAAELSELGLEDNRVLTPAAGGADGGEEKAVRAAIDDGLIPSGFAFVCAESLKRGRCLTAVNVSFGWSVKAMEIMDGAGAVDNHLLKPYAGRNPSPFSDIFGLPTLTKFVSSFELLPGRWRFTPEFLGMPILSKNQEGKANLSKPKRPWMRSFGLPILSDSKSKTRLSTPKRPWTKSFGFPMLAKNAAPLSSILGLPTSTRD